MELTLKSELDDRTVQRLLSEIFGGFNMGMGISDDIVYRVGSFEGTIITLNDLIVCHMKYWNDKGEEKGRKQVQQTIKTALNL